MAAVGEWCQEGIEAALAAVPGVGHVVYREIVESTIDVAWESAGEAGTGLLVVADAQRRGRGRAGRTWHSPPGSGLWISWLFRPDADPRRWPILSLIAGVATARALDDFGARLLLKWPNDLVAPDGTFRKAGGVLAESRSGDGPAAVVLSLGLNVNGDTGGYPEPLRESAVSLETLCGRPLDRLQILQAVMRAWSESARDLSEPATRRFLDAWRQRSAVLGRVVRLRESVAEVEGVARDVDENGALVVRLESGAEMVVRAGEVEVHWGRDE
ncbi:MAG: biotin--[acetyl-CoA-carboxylase] ligase [Thermoanaerobaculia bacterium]|nr:biotin--[acetyl-CoA-carboxylase] ligase [Thermoanaerobaculia bacterium]